MLCNEMRSHPTPDGSSRLVIYLFCVCVRVCAKAGRRGWCSRRPPPTPPAARVPATPRCWPAGRGNHRDTAHSVTGEWLLVGTPGAGPGTGWVFRGYSFISAGAPGADQRWSKCSGSMSFGLMGGRRGPRLKAHPIHLNFASEGGDGDTHTAGGESFLQAGKSRPVAGSSQRGGGGCVWRRDKASPR